MSRFPDLAALAAAGVLAFSAPAIAQDAAAGEKLFAKCRACHSVGEGAKNKVGPVLNGVVGRTAGGLEGYKYSPAMTKAGEGGLVWGEDTLKQYLANPKGFVKGTKMTFAGLKKDDELANMVAYLQTFSTTPVEQKSEAPAAAPEPMEQAAMQAPPQPAADAQPLVAPAAAAVADDADTAQAAAAPPGEGADLKLGRPATPDEVAAWDIDVRPDGLGLPIGRGTVLQGEPLYEEHCASCHGDFGEAIDRWPVLAGGQGTLENDRPEKTIGSYWPYLSTVYDYIRRAMPFGNARSLSDDEVYALTAYVLYLNDVVTEDDFELSNENFTAIRLPNEANFIADDRLSEAHYQDKSEPCMSDCVPGTATIKMHAAVLDVTPEDSSNDEAPAAGIE